MAHTVGDVILDGGLFLFSTAATGFYICSLEPQTYTEATSTYALGHKTWVAGDAWGAPEPASPSGRKVRSTSIDDGALTGSATAIAWAAVDDAAGVLLANGPMTPIMLAAGKIFTFPPVEVQWPNQ